MTEEEWNESKEIDAILGCVVEKLHPEAEPCSWGPLERKKRLLVAAFLRNIADQLPSGLTDLDEVWERYADGAEIPDATKARWDEIDRAGGESSSLLFSIGYDDIGMVSHDIVDIRARSTQASSVASARDSETGRHARLVRDIFGNPFRPVAFDPRWRTSDVAGLARTIYDDKAFERMSILADALMNSGCEDEQIISHCRGSGPHVRGCWVVDLILGKE